MPTEWLLRLLQGQPVAPTPEADCGGNGQAEGVPDEVSLITYHVPQHREKMQRAWRLLCKGEIEIAGVLLHIGTDSLPQPTLLENDRIGVSWSGLDLLVERSEGSEPLFAALEGAPVSISNKLALVFDEQLIPKAERDRDNVSLTWTNPPKVYADGLPDLLSPTLTRIDLYETHAYLILSSIFRIKVTW
jgi:hypothetical protein